MKSLIIITIIFSLASCSEKQLLEDSTVLPKNEIIKLINLDPLLETYKNNERELNKWLIINKYDHEVVVKYMEALAENQNPCSNLEVAYEDKLIGSNEFAYLKFSCLERDLFYKMNNKYNGFLKSLNNQDRSLLLNSNTTFSLEEVLKIRSNSEIY